MDGTDDDERGLVGRLSGLLSGSDDDGRAEPTPESASESAADDLEMMRRPPYGNSPVFPEGAGATEGVDLDDAEPEATDDPDETRGREDDAGVDGRS
jgi:hypothetical protein